MMSPGRPWNPVTPRGYHFWTPARDKVSVCLPMASPVAKPLKQPMTRSSNLIWIGSGSLGHRNIENRNPVLKRLKRKTAKHEPSSEHAQVSLGQVVGVILDVGNDRGSQHCRQTALQADSKGNCPDVIP